MQTRGTQIVRSAQGGLAARVIRHNCFWKAEEIAWRSSYLE